MRDVIMMDMRSEIENIASAMGYDGMKWGWNGIEWTDSVSFAVLYSLTSSADEHTHARAQRQ